MTRHELAIWMNRVHVGVWRWAAAGHAHSHSFEYSEGWLGHAFSRALSLSLPITADRMVRGERVMHYFDNLLPDSDIIREPVRKRYKLKSLDPAQLPALFPEEVWSSIRDGIHRQCSIFLAGQSGVTG